MEGRETHNFLRCLFQQFCRVVTLVVVGVVVVLFRFTMQIVLKLTLRVLFNVDVVLTRVLLLLYLYTTHHIGENKCACERDHRSHVQVTHNTPTTKHL